MKRFFFSVSLCLLFAFFCGSSGAQETLPSRLSALLNKDKLTRANLGILVLPADETTPVLSLNAERPMNPASTMKIITSLVALEELGPNYRWSTTLLSEQKINKAKLDGTLYLRGGGDPNFTVEKLGSLLRRLRYLGVQKIKGDIVLDRRFFQPARPDLIAPSFDEAPTAYYNVVPDALLIHSNLVALAINATSDNIDVQLQSTLSDVSIVNHLVLSDAPCAEWEKHMQAPQFNIKARAAIEIGLFGTFPRKCHITSYFSHLDRNTFIENTIRTLWKEMGGTWQGRVQDGVTPNTATVLVDYLSDTLVENIRNINKFSDNSMARSIYLTLGAEANARNLAELSKNQSNGNETTATTAQTSELQVRRWLNRHNINDQGIVLENGSGLSRIERLNAMQLARVLQEAYRSKWYPEFASSLPIVALDGTMRKRLKASVAEQRARIKTGTLRDALAIAGYVRDSENKDWIVVAFINTDGPVQGKQVLDDLILWVAQGRPSDPQ
ncbi:MAG: D-alanyl-D-alanine carboxypeptidase/D-alanyl-D-alanine-endopeptidase [Burkholderiaceae bacterium]|nr:D-alanyl-D-alanine carboxypeptidase/D-alanyl-D-alanine-endopeptidase [Burkholderiaceae bacterium]